MKTTLLEPETCKRVFEFEIPAETIDAAIKAKLKEYKRDLQLPGFRQGKVPDAVVKQRYEGAARGAVIEDTVNSSYKTACEQHKITPVCEAKVTDIKGAEKENEILYFTIETEIEPDIEINGYDKLKIKVKSKKINDTDVDAQFESSRDRLAKFNDVDRASQKGDYVSVEYRKVTIDGEERPDIQNPVYPFEIGETNALKDFDKGLTGVKAGDDIDIIVEFPKDYSDSTAADKTGVFSVTVKSVQEKCLPEVDKHFLNNFGDFETVDALKAAMRKDMEAEEEKNAKKEAHREAIEKLIEANPFDVPQSKIETFIDIMIKDAVLQNRNAPIGDNERAELAEHFRPSAIMALKRIRIVDYIADKEKIKATQEEVDKEIEKMSELYGHDFDQLKQAFRMNGTTNRIRLDIRERKTLDFLIGV